MHDIDIDKLEKLIIRIAIFSVLYTFPGKYKHNPTQCKFNCNPKMHQILSRVTLYSAALLIGSQFYESWWREEALKKSICSCEIEEIKFSETEIQVILLRYCMHLIPGIGAGIWICTPKVFLLVPSWTP